MFAFVDLAVVGAAEEYQVGEFGFAPFEPVDDVVSVAPALRPVTAFEAAPAVSEVEGSSHCGGGGAGTASNVEGF